jgi:hypothetical protein
MDTQFRQLQIWSVASLEVTRLSTLQRAASLCGHDPLLELVEAWNIWNCRGS